MGAKPAIFQSAGRISNHYRPGAYSRRNFVPDAGGGVSSGNICIMGPSETGKPHELLVFATANDARAALTAGEGLEGIIQAFNPGNDLVPQQVGFMRVNKGTQSTRTLKLSAADQITVKSFDYGVPMNQIRLKFSAGSVSGYKIETAYKTYSYSADNIEKESFSIQYVGAGTACTMTIDGTNLTTTVTGGPGGEDLNIALADFPSISELVQTLNTYTGVYSAEVLTGAPSELCSELDYVTGVDIFTDVYNAKSDLQAVLDALAITDFLGDIAFVGTARQVPDLDSGFVYLSGGTYGAYTTTEWSEALEVLKKEDVQLISTPSTELAVHILIKDHCVYTNSVEGRNERQFYVGGGIGESISTLKANSLTLNSSFGSVCSPGYYQFNDQGNRTLYAPSYFACKQVGMVSALGLNTPTTHKTMNVLGWEKDYSDPQQDELIQAGVLIGGRKRNGTFITIRSVTSYQAASLQQNEASIMRETLYQDRDLREAIEAVIGTPNLGNIQLATVDSIFQRKISDWFELGIIIPYDDNTLFKGYTRRIVGDIIEIQYNTRNTAPTNFAFITHNIEVATTA